MAVRAGLHLPARVMDRQQGIPHPLRDMRESTPAACRPRMLRPCARSGSRRTIRRLPRRDCRARCRVARSGGPHRSRRRDRPNADPSQGGRRLRSTECLKTLPSSRNACRSSGSTFAPRASAARRGADQRRLVPQPAFVRLRAPRSRRDHVSALVSRRLPAVCRAFDSALSESRGDWYRGRRGGPFRGVSRTCADSVCGALDARRAAKRRLRQASPCRPWAGRFEPVGGACRPGGNIPNHLSKCRTQGTHVPRP